MGLKRKMAACFSIIVGLFVLSAASKGSAEPAPPWLNSVEEMRLGEATAEEYWNFANWYLDRQEDPDISLSTGYLMIPFIIYDLAYPFLNPSNDDPFKAVALAERITIRVFDAKEVIQADLRYAPSGLDPDPERYELAIRKTALYLAQFGGGFFIDIEPSSGSSADTNDLLDGVTSSEPASRSILNYYRLKQAANNGDSSAFARIREAMGFLPDIVNWVHGSDPCSLLEEAISFYQGTNERGQDKELAEILYHTATSHPEIGTIGPDFYYWHSQMLTDFLILPGPEDFSWDLLDVASASGHPNASLLLGQRAIGQGEIKEAQEYLIIAARHDIAEAKKSLSQLLTDHGNLLSNEDEMLVNSMFEAYDDERCKNLAIQSD